ncbi:GNAT family N-acetyltransferase [Kribbella sp. NPDC026611]|uniref:GNAT family N-acetyltransferase n=1 Tax=Kribbella sp. NPDC026611 TaxID=3154911 RepID=UPI0033F02925
MTADLRIVPVDDETTLLDWQFVHNTIIPTAELSVEEVRERVTRNVLEVAYDGDMVVGCSTVRPPAEDVPEVTVIARVLPPYRRRGFGDAIYRRALARGQELGGSGVLTVVLASNTDGLAFAAAQGFAEVERYVLPGDTIPFVELRLGE